VVKAPLRKAPSDCYHRRMKLSDFHFDLPDTLIAQHPPVERSAGRLLEFGRRMAPVDRLVRDLPDRVLPGDLMVFNNTRVLRARLRGHKTETGGRVELLVERVLSDNEALCQIGSSKPVRAGTSITLDSGLSAEVLSREAGFCAVRFDTADLHAVLQGEGELPLPPYIARSENDADEERYQTVYASCPGAVAAPTAGLHFDTALFDALAQRGVETTEITLHVGAGTFQPVRVDNVAEHRMHAEWLTVSEEVADAVRACQARGGRVIAVGTTSVRALETAARASDGRIAPYTGDSRLFLTPGEPFHVVDGMLTNFHLPGSTLLMLISAFAGMETVREAYAHAVTERYQFFSYGDACLIWP